jgi:negative regulator of sigma-B (phosphoserine phosphatase)
MDSDRVGSGLIEWGIAMQAFAGEADSGDGYLVEAHPAGVLVAAVDGLGHGPKAAAVAKIAIAALEGHASESVELLVKRCHRELRRTRGVVMSLAAFSVGDETLTWVGVGNVTGLLLRADRKTERPRETLLSRGGVVGYHLPSLYPAVHPVYPGDTLVFATDGLRSGFPEGVALEHSPQQIADHLLGTYGRGTDDALVLVARYIGGRGRIG